MQTKTVAMILFGVVYLGSIAAEATLLGTDSITSAVGLPLLSSTVTLGLGAALALVEPGGSVTGHVAPQAAVTPQTPLPAVTTAPEPVQATPGPVPAPAETPGQITGQAAAPAMPTGGR